MCVTFAIDQVSVYGEQLALGGVYPRVEAINRLLHVFPLPMPAHTHGCTRTQTHIDTNTCV